MKKIYLHRFEFLLGGLILTLIALVAYPPQNEYLRFLFQIATLADTILIFLVFRKLWESKWKKFLIQGIRKIINTLIKKVFRFLENNKIFRKRKNTLKGEIKVINNFTIFGKEKKRSAKPQKWSQMQSPQDKLNFLYRHMIKQRIDHGERIYCTDTPLEIKHKKENQESDELIFDLYIDHRYDDRITPDEQQIVDIKNRYYPKLK